MSDKQDKWADYKVSSSKPSGENKWDAYKAVSVKEQKKEYKKENKIISAAKTYFKEAQPAFKLAVTHPETFTGSPAMGKGGIPLTPQQLEQQTQAPWSDVYRQADLPFSKSTSTAGQMIPQAAGMALDIGTRPSAYIAPYAAGKAGLAAASNPVTRRFLQTQTPTLSKSLLANNPMKPIYKEVNGLIQDITKPLAPKPSKLAGKGMKVVESINKTIDDLGDKYIPLVGKNKVTKAEINATIPPKTAAKLGVDTSKIKTTADLWKARTTIRKAISDPWAKQELLKNTTLKEDAIMNILNKMKASVMDKMSPEQRSLLDVLDSQYGEVLSSGKGIIARLYNPKTKVVNIEGLAKSLKGKEGTAAQLFKRFSYFDKSITKFQSNLNTYRTKESIKKFVGQTTKWGLGLTAGKMVGEGLIDYSR